MAASIDSPVTISGIDTVFPLDSPEAEDCFFRAYFEDLDRDIANIDGWVDHITKALELIRLGFYNSAAIEIGSGEDILEEDPERVLEIATLYYNAEDYFNSLQLIYRNIDNIRTDLSDRPSGICLLPLLSL